MAIYATLPWIEVGGHPAIFLDIEHRHFYLFGATFNAQDAWLAFFLITGAGFVLLVIAALLGRVWCGYACPQTVFLEGVFRRLERWIEGPRNERIRRNAGPLGWAKAWRKLLKHGIYLFLAINLAHIFLSYFVSLPELMSMVSQSPGEHPRAFAWMVGMTAVMYINFAFFREQLCLVVCPYGRLQSVLMDKDSLLVGYDARRGEPRGKPKKSSAGPADRGDCVDCHRCVVVCPTGIDIRNGLQLDCVGCANCVDACDEVMKKLGRAPGLVRYDSLRGLDGEERRFLRPRLAFYAVLGAVGLIVASFAMQAHTSFEANLLRQRGAPFAVLEDGSVRNGFTLHLVNKSRTRQTFEIEGVSEAMEFQIIRPRVEIDSLENLHIPIFVTRPAGSADAKEILVEVRRVGSEEKKPVDARFQAPAQ